MHPDQGPGSGATIRYHERLSPTPGTWAAAAVLPIGLAISVAPLGPVASLAALFVVGAAVAAGLWNHSGVVRVTEGVDGPQLQAGRARIPVRLLTGALPYVAESADEQRRHRLDPRAYLMLRGWIPGVVKVELNDPADPTPYWLVSSRRPDQLARAINEACERS